MSYWIYTLRGNVIYGERSVKNVSWKRGQPDEPLALLQIQTDNKTEWHTLGPGFEITVER